ncbi:hypothetical protein CFO_g1150 [Ceratocystis platani]|uniref:Uncharacterized protein n=1 Tax=Ceratocystis fimbriata f. sp. platani TaxID=88771 RepID=A0A0F8B457_CERFI|nr:hypothetical protein CFO_g1150 [Ceratocystis platani]
MAITGVPRALLNHSKDGVSILPVSGWEVQFSMLPGETAVGCCPEGYSCTADLANGIAQTCIQYNTMGTLSTLSCNGASTITGSTVLSNYDSFTGYAPLIQINFRDVDIGKTSATQTVSGSNLGSARASAKATGTGAATNTDSPIIVAEGATSGSSNNGLSTKAHMNRQPSWYLRQLWNP